MKKFRGFRHQTIDDTLARELKHPWGTPRMGLETGAKLNRNGYRIKYNDVLETGMAAAGDEIEIQLNAEPVKAWKRAGEISPIA